MINDYYYSAAALLFLSLSSWPVTWHHQLGEPPAPPTPPCTTHIRRQPPPSPPDNKNVHACTKKSKRKRRPKSRRSRRRDAIARSAAAQLKSDCWDVASPWPQREEGGGIGPAAHALHTLICMKEAGWQGSCWVAPPQVPGEARLCLGRMTRGRGGGGAAPGTRRGREGRGLPKGRAGQWVHAASCIALV